MCYNKNMIAEVIVDIGNAEVDKIFEYLVEDNSVKVGCFVRVPFGNRNIEGFVVKVKDTSEYDFSKLKPISSLIFEEPVIKSEHIALMEYMVKHYYLKMVDVLRLFLPSELRGGRVRAKYFSVLEVVDRNALEQALMRQRASAKNIIGLIQYLLEVEREELTTLANKFGYANVNKLIEQGLVTKSEVRAFRKPISEEKKENGVVLNELQQKAVEVIDSAKGETVLLFGVTGSGKTEVYMNAIKKTLSRGKTAIMLVPEIGLTPQVASNFKAKFGDMVAVLHSGLSAGERYDEWDKLLRGEARIVVGARSAIFAPIENVGLIVIDEEHDSSYISDSNPRYSTIEVAQFRARYNNCPLVLGSATPSIESFYRAQKGEYRLVEMPIRANKKALPNMTIVDMYQGLFNGEYSTISSVLASKLNQVVNDKKQALIFINRRGFVSFKRCLNCGFVPTCSDCDVSLVYHKEDNELKCHFCGKRYRAINKCPECGGDKFRDGATGTQKVVDELKASFPNVPIFRMDNDTTKNKNAHHKILSEFSECKPAILVGTQMIAKGHDFPFITLVGIVDADLALHQADFRAVERCYQLITQVAGRAGRGEYTGEVVLQTYAPKHYVYTYASSYDYVGFYKKEIALRDTTHFPPFTKVLRVLFSGDELTDIMNEMKVVHEKILSIKDNYPSAFIFLKAVACPVKKIKTKLRYEILMRLASDSDKIVPLIYDAVRLVNTKKVNVFVELNPQTLS